MFGSSILDVVIGVIFTFLGVSLASSAITEAIASGMKLRQKTLLEGVKALLNDPKLDGLAKDLYAHALVNPLSSGKDLAVTPAYIQSRHFAIALHDILQAKAPQKPLGLVIDDIPDDQLRQTFKSLLSAADNDTARFRGELATWFDSAMERLSGWYKRRTQIIAFATAIMVAAMLNADAIHVTTTLWARSGLTDTLTAGLHSDVHDFQGVLSVLDGQRLIGWQGWTLDPKSPVLGAIFMLLGWSIAAAASLFGAAFWFDILQRIVSIRGTGTAVRSTPHDVTSQAVPMQVRFAAAAD